MTPTSIDWASPIPGFVSATFERIEPARNVHRWYMVAYQVDLFGEGFVLRAWGRGRPQRQLATHFPSLEAAWPKIRATARLRLRHGYSVKQLLIFSTGVK